MSVDVSGSVGLAVKSCTPVVQTYGFSPDRTLLGSPFSRYSVIVLGASAKLLSQLFYIQA